MMGDASQHSGSETTCEECGTEGAKPLEVKFGDENARTFELCEECLQAYRAADLVDEMALVDHPNSEAMD